MLAFFSVAESQETGAAGVLDRAPVIAAATEIMTKARFCTLITLGEDGHPQARVVDPFSPEAGMVLWIGINPVTRKVREIRKNPRVTVGYLNPDGSGHVTLLGSAEVDTDSAEKQRHYQEGLGISLQ
jgi:general stress protein 26